jgi:uncharacterized protein
MSVALSPPEVAMMRSVFRIHGQVREVRLFGSRAKGVSTPRSDVDLALFGGLTPLQTEAIAAELDDLPLPYKYDVVSFERLRSEELRDHIRRAGVSIYPDLSMGFPATDRAAVAAIESCYRNLMDGKADIWRTLRDLSTEDLRALVTLALRDADGSYRKAASLLGAGQGFRRFMDLIRRKDCIVDFQPFQRVTSPD